jgi:hypothetical protein
MRAAILLPQSSQGCPSSPGGNGLAAKVFSMHFADRCVGRLRAGAAASLCLGLVVLAFGAAAEEAAEWQEFDPKRFPIVSEYAPLSEPLLAHGEKKNQLGGQTIMVKFRYEGEAFALVVYNESTRKLQEPSMVAATQQALSSYPLFKDGGFTPGELGSAVSPLGSFEYQVVHAQQQVESEPLRSCAVFQHLRSAGMTALTGFFCDRSESFTQQEVNAFFATLGIRGIALPK